MKVKFGDITARQLAEICNAHIGCSGCPFINKADSAKCYAALSATEANLEEKIDLPDEEENER